MAIPAFTRIEPYRSPDGQEELDALAQDGVAWAVEVKWRQRRVGQKELQQFAGRANALAARAWCISQSGFTPDAATYAREQGILCSTGSDLDALMRLAAGP